MDRVREEENKRQALFTEKLGQLAGDFLSMQEAKDTEFEKLFETAQADLSKHGETLVRAVSGHIEAIELLKKRAEDLVGVITNVGMVGGYQQNANSARKQGWTWQLITVVSIGGLIGFAIWAFVGTQAGTPDDGFNWAMFAGRAFAAATFAVLTAFGIRQTERHHQTERRDRNKELELAAIDPYLMTLPPEKRHEIKEELARRLFGQQSTLLSETTQDRKAVRGLKGACAVRAGAGARSVRSA